MTLLFIAREDEPATIAADPIFLLDAEVKHPSTGETYKSAMMEADSSKLTGLTGEYRIFMFDDKPIWGRLLSLRPATSTPRGLGLLSIDPTLLGIIETIAEDSTRLRIEPFIRRRSVAGSI